MKNIYLLLLLLPAVSFAQTTHIVEAGGSTSSGPLPYYAPQELTIDVGDIVHWTGVSGTHNVNGTTMHFPNNPESFLSGQPVQNLDFQFTFTIPGVYQYHCEQEGHDATQFGTITVIDGNSVEEHNASGIDLFPVPTNDLLIVDLGDQDIRKAEVHGLDGRLISTLPVNGTSRIQIGTSALANGQYYLRLTDGNGRQITRPFRKD